MGAVRVRHVTVGDGVVEEHVLERVVYVAERGPVGGGPLPAGAHQLVDRAGAAGRALHAVPLRNERSLVHIHSINKQI